MTLLIRPEPFTRDVDRLFERLFDSQAGAQRWVPAMDLTEADDHYVLKADLPGMPEEDVSIEVDHGVLTLSGERQPSTSAASGACIGSSGPSASSSASSRCQTASNRMA